jgi:hypothetical protein
MKSSISLVVALLFLAAEGLSQQEQLYRQAKRPAFSRSAPITNSFVFLNGEYLETPYIVSCSNLVIQINGRVIADYSSQLAAAPSIPRERPAVPASFSKETVWHDPAVGEYLADSMRFLSAAGGNTDDKVGGMEDVYKRLPFVKDVRWDGGADLKVTTIDGEVHVCSIAFPSRQPENTPEKIGIRIDKECAHLVNSLMEENSVFYFTHFGKRVSFGRNHAENKLPNLLNIAHSAELSDKEKAAMLAQEMAVEFDMSNEHSAFVRRLATNRQFEARVKKLIEAKEGRKKKPEDLRQNKHGQNR